MTSDHQPQNASSEEHGQVFRLDPRHRTLGLVTLPSFVAIGIASAVVAWFHAVRDRWMLMAFFILFWGFFATLAAWLLLACRREYLKITHDRITHQGVIRQKGICFADVEAAIWRSQPQHGKVLLRTSASKVNIHLENFTPEDRLRIIELLRAELPEVVQTNWELFCHRVAVPLREKVRQPVREPKKDEILITRRRWDWLFLPIIVLTLVFGLVMWLAFEQPRMLVAPVAPVGLWLFLRITTPKSGLIAKRLSITPERSRLLWISLCFVVLFLATAFFDVTVAMVFAFVLFGWMTFIGYRFDRQRLQRDCKAAPMSAKMWEEGG